MPSPPSPPLLTPFVAVSSPLNHPRKPSSFSPLRFASSRAEPLLPLPRLVAAVAMAAASAKLVAELPLLAFLDPD